MDATTSSDGLQSNSASILLSGSGSEMLSTYQWTQFHEFILKNQFIEVKKFVETNPEVHLACNTNKKSALTVALESKNYRIYSFLRSKGFECGNNEDHGSIFNELDSNEREKIKISHREFFISKHNAHIEELLVRSQLNFNNNQNSFEKIQFWYEALDKILVVSDILKLVATAETLSIIFDFNRDSVSDVDPTQDDCVNGRVIYKGPYSGIIMIGAKNQDVDVMATMAHEFGHLAMHLLFNNDGDPYFLKDIDEAKNFGNIVEFFKDKNKEARKEEIIDGVYRYYGKEEYAKELIVRVPHLLTYYSEQPEKLMEIKADSKMLFDYFDEKVLQLIRKEIPLMKSKQLIENLNQQFGVYSDIETAKIYSHKLSPSLTDAIESSDKIFIQSNLPEITLKDFVEKLKANEKEKVKSSHIFVKLAQFLYSDQLKKAFQSAVNPKIFVISTSDMNFYKQDELQDILEIFSSRVILISDQKSDKTILFDDFREITHKWIDLSEFSQDHVLSKSLNFCGRKLSLNQIMDRDAKFLKEQLSLLDILKIDEMRLPPQALELPAYVFYRAAYFYQKMDSVQYTAKIPEKNQNFEMSYDFVNYVFTSKDKFGKKSEKTYRWKDLSEELIDDLVRQFTDSLKKQNKLSYVIFEKSNLLDRKIEEGIKSIFNSKIPKPCKSFSLSFSDDLLYKLGKLFNENELKSQLYHIKLQELLCDVLLKNFTKRGQKNEILKNAVKFLIFFVESSEVFQPNTSCTIVSDGAGYGKTIFAKQLAIEFQQRYPTTWTFFIDLKQYADCFKYEEVEKPIKFDSEYFGKYIVKLNGSELKLFEHFFKEAKIFFIFDGFDEISPNYKALVMKIMKSVQNSGNKFLVTTRTHMAEELEEFLGEKAVKLMPFSEDDRKKILRKLLSAKFTTSSNEEIELKVNNIVKKFKHSSFFNVPLHLMLLAEIVLEDPHETQINRYSLYNSFIRKKIEIFCKDKGLIAADDNAKINISSMNILQIHQKIVLEMFFPKMVESLFSFCLDDFCLTEEMICRIGLVTQIGKGRLQYVHFSFAEYLLADFVLTNIKKVAQSADNNYFIEIFCLIFNLKKDQFMSVRLFIDEGIKPLVKFSHAKLLVKILEKQQVEQIFECSFSEKLANVVEFTLSLYEKGSEHNDKLMCSAKHNLNYAVNDFRTFCILWKFIVSVYDGVELRKFLLHHFETPEQNLIFSALDLCADDRVLKFILNEIALLMPDEKDFVKLLLQKNKKNVTSLVEAAKSNRFKIMWNEIKNNLGMHSQIEVLLELTQNEMFFKSQSPPNETFSELLKSFKEFFDSEESRRLTDTKQIFISVSIFFSFCFENEIFQLFWSFIKNNFDQQSQKLIFLSKNSSGFSFVSGYFKTGHFSENSLVLDTVLGSYQPIEIRKASQMIQHYYDRSYLILHFLEKRFGLDYVIKYFCIRDEKGLTLFHEVSEFAYGEQVAMKYITFASKFFHPNDIKKILLLEDNNSRIPIQNCSRKNSRRKLRAFWIFYRKVFGDSELEKILFDKSRKIFVESKNFKSNFHNLKFLACNLFGNEKVLRAIEVAENQNRETLNMLVYLLVGLHVINIIWMILSF